MFDVFDISKERIINNVPGKGFQLNFSLNHTTQNFTKQQGKFSGLSRRLNSRCCQVSRNKTSLCREGKLAHFLNGSSNAVAINKDTKEKWKKSKHIHCIHNLILKTMAGFVTL